MKHQCLYKPYLCIADHVLVFPQLFKTTHSSSFYCQAPFDLLYVVTLLITFLDLLLSLPTEDWVVCVPEVVSLSTTKVYPYFCTINAALSMILSAKTLYRSGDKDF